MPTTMSHSGRDVSACDNEGTLRAASNIRQDWNDPYSFFNSVYKAKDENLNVSHVITGSLGTLLGLW